MPLASEASPDVVIGAHLQRIAQPPGVTVKNLSGPGIRLQAAARSCTGYMLETRGYGFMDGGCRMLAEALVEWSGGKLTLWAVHKTDDPVTVQHMVAAWRDEVFLDCDGICRAAEMTAKMARLEHAGACFMKPFTGMPSEQDLDCDAAVVANLARRLRDKLGDFADFGLDALAVNPEATGGIAPGL